MKVIILLVHFIPFGFKNPPEFIQKMNSKIWCRATNVDSCIKIDGKEVVYYHNSDVTEKVKLSEKTLGDNWVIYSLGGNNEIMNKYILISDDSLMVKGFDFGVERKRGSLYISKK